MAKKEEKKLDLKEIIAEMQKDLGEGAITYASEELGMQGVIPFSFPSLNRITGIGGIPRGRLVEISGMDGTFKSTIVLDSIANEQKLGGTCAFIDAEFSFSPEYAEKLGVDTEKLILIHPASAEEAFGVIEKLIDSGQVSLIALDSIAALSPNTELENEFGKSNIGVMARLLNQALRKLTAKAGKTNTTLFFINQQRELLGQYIPMKTTPGGNGVRFFASMRFENNKSQIKEGTDVVGVNIKIKVTKNKLSVPYLNTELECIYGIGVDKQKDLINECSDLGIISKGGAGWFEIAGQKMQGLDKVKQFLIDNPEYEEELINKLKEKNEQ